MRVNPPLALPLLLAPVAAFATPSGLNNIPTADTTPQGTFVLQAYNTVSGNAETRGNFPDNGQIPSWTLKGNFVVTF